MKVLIIVYNNLNAFSLKLTMKQTALCKRAAPADTDKTKYLLIKYLFLALAKCILFVVVRRHIVFQDFKLRDTQ